MAEFPVESVRDAVDQALAEMELPAKSRGLVAAIRKMADQIDAIDENGLNPAGKLDNVSLPTFLKYADALGMLPSGAASKPEPEAKPAGKLGGLKVMAGGLAQ